MSVNTLVTLPPGTPVRDVADVLGIAAGLPWEMRSFGAGNAGAWLHVPGAFIDTTDVPPMLEIVLSGPMVDGELTHRVFWHYEWSLGDQPGCVGLMPSSTPFWGLVACRLVDTFGGTVDFDDSDDIDVDYARPPRVRPAEDGQAWQDYQDGMAETAPISPAEMVLAEVAWAEAS